MAMRMRMRMRRGRGRAGAELGGPGGRLGLDWARGRATRKSQAATTDQLSTSAASDSRGVLCSAPRVFWSCFSVVCCILAKATAAVAGRPRIIYVIS
ncbi:hypothetical protein BDV09DRAFT_157523 [Aspergillus tetrazonus]